jgi:hypothetical protein
MPQSDGQSALPIVREIIHDALQNFAGPSSDPQSSQLEPVAQPEDKKLRESCVPRES